MRHFLTLNDFGKDEILEMINLAREIKKEAKARDFKPLLLMLRASLDASLPICLLAAFAVFDAAFAAFDKVATVFVPLSGTPYFTNCTKHFPGRNTCY